MPRTTVSSRELIHPYYLKCIAASGQKIQIAKTATNQLDGLSAVTMVIRCRISAVVNGGNICSSPNDSVQTALVLKNRNTTAQAFRLNSRMGGSTHNFDATTNVQDYNLNDFMSLAVRYDGANVEIWKDGLKIASQAATGAFAASTTNSWFVCGDGGGNTPATQDVVFFRVWTSALSNANLVAAMQSGYKTGSVIDLELNEGTGTPVDLANNATVTLSGTPTWQQMLGRTPKGYALDFNTNVATAYVDLGSGTVVNQNSPVSVSFWALRRVLGNTERVLGRYTGGAWDMEFTSGNLVNLNFFGGPSNSSTTAISDVTTWHHIVCTYDASLGSNQIKIYLDGALDRQITQAATLSATTGNFRISNNGTGTRSWIDDLRLFNAALSLTDVQNLNARNGIQPSGLILWTKFDEGWGTTALDSSSSGVNGTLNGLPLYTPSAFFATARSLTTARIAVS